MLNIIESNSIQKIINNEDLAVILFSDLGCNVCLSIFPDLENMELEYPKAKFVMADVKEMKLLVGEHLIFAYPTIIIFAQGKETKRFERLFSINDIESTLNRYYQMIFE